MEIQSVTIVTTAGGKSYAIGDTIQNAGKITRIKVDDLHFQGDPYSHYIGYGENGEMLFSVNCYVPCVVEYLQD
jgi:hypothetical protein